MVELHRNGIAPASVLRAARCAQGTRTHTLMKCKPRLTYLNEHLSDREFLLDHFTVADAYLYAVLNWSVATRVSLSRCPAIKEYHRRLRIRPSVARAYQEELMLYRAKL